MERTSVWLFAAAFILALLLPTAPRADPSASQRIVISYAEPADPSHRSLARLLKEKRALERVRDLLTPIKWPRPLTIELKGCDGEANAWYADASVTVCYEFLSEIWSRASSRKRPDAITLEDAFVGPTLDVFLHEAAHAIFDLLKIPLLGREEDAADQVAAYTVLQLPPDERRRLVIGTAYSHGRALNVRTAGDLYRPRLQIGRHVTYSEVHGTPAQRLYNLLCIAYGSDKVQFSDLVSKGYLPKDRAEICEIEYRQVELAYRVLIAPHRDETR